MTDEEWAIISPLIPPAKRGGNKRTVDVRAIVNGVMYILSTGCQWAALPKDPPPRSSVNDYLRRWDDDRTLGRIHHALYVLCREKAGREASPTAAIIDSQSVKSAEKRGPHRSSAPSPGSIDVVGLPRTGSASTKPRAPSCAGLPSASCCEGYVKKRHDPGWSLRGEAGSVRRRCGPGRCRSPAHCPRARRRVPRSRCGHSPAHSRSQRSQAPRAHSARPAGSRPRRRAARQ